MPKARTAIQLSEMWTGEVAILRFPNGPDPATQYCAVTGPGGIVAWGPGDPAYYIGQAKYDQRPYNQPPYPRAWYAHFVLTLGLPGIPNRRVTAHYCVHVADFYGMMGPYTWPLPYPILDELRASFKYELTDVTLGGKVTTPGLPNNRRAYVMDFTDRLADYTWLATNDTSIRISASLPGGYGHSVSWNLELEPGQEVELGDWFTLWYNFQTKLLIQNEPYCEVANVRWGGEAVDVSRCDLWWAGQELPADRAPFRWDETTKKWSRYEEDATSHKIHVYNNGSAIRIRREGDSTLQEYYWLGATTSPWLASFVPHAQQFADDGPNYDMTYECNALDWYQDEQGRWRTRNKVFTGRLDLSQWGNSWEFEHEWKKFPIGVPLWVRVYQPWRESNNEDVGSSIPEDYKYNDQACGILLYPLTASSMTGDPHWGPFISVTKQPTIDVNDPPAAATRPSLWQGIRGIQVDPGDNDVWHVQPQATQPTVLRQLVSRWDLRMNRLMDRGAAKQQNPNASYNPDWPIILKANAQYTFDEPEWETAIPYEDITNWDNFSYLRLALESPTTGEITVQVTWAVPQIYDPCTTCFEHRYGAEGGFTATSKPYTATYKANVTIGSNDIAIDLALPNERFIPAVITRQQIVQTITIILPDNTTDDIQTYELVALELIHDPTPVTGQGGEHIRYRVVPNWAWYEPVGAQEDWFGFGAIVDGKPCLCVDYGYHTYRYEPKLLYIQHRVHCPDSELTDRLDHAKPLSRLVDELNWQEGWTATYHDPLNASGNKDSDGEYLAPEMYWFDVRNCREWLENETLDGAVQVGAINIAAGVRFELHFHKYPRGRIQCIVVNEDWTERIRDVQQVVTCYKRPIGGQWQVQATYSTTPRGWFRTMPLYEKGYEYRIGENGPVLRVANREYTWPPAFITQVERLVYLAAAITGRNQYLCSYSLDDNIRYIYSNPPMAYFGFPPNNIPWSLPIQAGQGTIGSISITPHAIRLVYSNQGVVYVVSSVDFGRTWGTPVSLVYGSHPAVWHNSPGEPFHVVLWHDGALKYYISTDNLQTLQYRSTIANVEETDCAIVAPLEIYVLFTDGDTLKCARSDDGLTWTIGNVSLT